MFRFAAQQGSAALSVLLCMTAFLAIGYVAGDCDTLDKDVQLKLDSFLSRLPAHYPLTHLRDDAFGGGLLVVGNATVGGLNWLEPDRRFEVFHKEDQTRVIARLRSTFLEVNTTWTLCSGDSGTVSTHSRLVGYEFVLIVNGTGEDAVLKLESVTPVLLERLHVKLYGAGSVASMVFSIAGYLLAGLVRMYWSDIVSAYVERACEDTLSQL